MRFEFVFCVAVLGLLHLCSVECARSKSSRPRPSSNKNNRNRHTTPSPSHPSNNNQEEHRPVNKVDTKPSYGASAPPYPPPNTNPNKFQPQPPPPGFKPAGGQQPSGIGFKPSYTGSAPHPPSGTKPSAPPYTPVNSANYRPSSYVPPPSYHGHPSPPAHPPAYHPPPAYYQQNSYRPQPPPPPGYYGGAPSYYQSPYRQQNYGGYPSTFPSSGGVTIINNYGGGGGGFGGGYGGGFGGYGGGYGSRGSGVGSNIASGLLGAYVGYKIGKWSSDISNHAYNRDPYTTSWGAPRPTSYSVHHYHHDADAIPKKTEVQANNLVFCEGSTSVCAPGTNSICMSNGTIMCLGPPQKIEPCKDNTSINCIRTTIECYNATDPKCNKDTNTTIVDMPCISSVNISGTLNTTALFLQQKAVEEAMKNETVNGTSTGAVNTTDVTNINGTLSTNGTLSLNTTLLQNINYTMLTSTPDFCVTVVAMPVNKTTEEKYWADYYRNYYDNYVNNIVGHTSFWLEKAFVNLWSSKQP